MRVALVVSHRTPKRKSRAMPGFFMMNDENSQSRIEPFSACAMLQIWFT